jgi:hypothetical protein
MKVGNANPAGCRRRRERLLFTHVSRIPRLEGIERNGFGERLIRQNADTTLS